MNKDIEELLPATAGPAPTFYSDADGDIPKVVLHMTSVDTGEEWNMVIEPVFGSKLRVRTE